MLLLGFGGYHQSWAIGNNDPSFHPYLLPQRLATTKPRRDRILAANLLHLFRLCSRAASVIGARQSGNILGFVEGEFVRLFQDILEGVN